MKNVARLTFARAKALVLLLVAYVIAPAAMAANSDVDVGGSSSGPLQQVSDFFQEIVDWVAGPGVILIAFFSAAGAIALWVAAPKAGSAALGWLLRVVVGVIVLFNIGLLLTWLQGF